MLVISKSEMSKLSPNISEEQKKRDIRDAVAAWLAFKPKWESEFKPVHTPTLEQVYNIARWLYAWSQEHGFTQQASYVTLVVLVLKALYMGGNKQYVEKILATIEGFGHRQEDIESALSWLDYAIDARIGMTND